MVAFMEPPRRRPMIIIDQFGGAVARVPNDATAFGHRDAAYDLIIAAIWSDPQSKKPTSTGPAVLGRHAALLAGDVYVNYLSDEGESGSTPPTATTRPAWLN